ncbi:hypothetical protein GE061_016272 [Apolygus lucorum]|uniref:Uncharacterized protein n=1 Tax=Apolygus lucorum TaxID=248454 RepID=A0A6A4K6L6_APOLU|nr:hypothetical protein GE061_016272 [Apolygus lucorum]
MLQVFRILWMSLSNSIHLLKFRGFRSSPLPFSSSESIYHSVLYKLDLTRTPELPTAGFNPKKSIENGQNFPIS